jgi:molybdate transport system ATP-binding protein
MSSLHVRVIRKTNTFTVDVAFQADPGITILFGPSGAGKSTTLGMIAGLIRPDEGQIRLGEVVWFDASAKINRPIEARKVGYVFQSLALFPHLTAAENVAYGLASTCSRKEARDRATSMLDRFRVGHLRDRRPRTFSGGEAQRVALARALAFSPSILLLDEPFSALDRALQRELHLDVRKVVESEQLPVILITHHPSEARALGDSMLQLRDGRIEASGTPEELLNKQHSYQPDNKLDFADTPMGHPLGEV